MRREPTGSQPATEEGDNVTEDQRASAETTQGTIDFHDWIGDGWAILFSHPKDFTPVCTTELGYMAGLKPEFDKRNTKIIGLSVDPVENHAKWAQDIEETQGHAVNYPMIGDTELKVATAYDMLPEGAGTTSDGRTAADNATVRSVFVIGPDKKVKAMLTYPMSTGRNFDEVLRLLDSCQLTAKHTVATPVNWKPGEDVIIPPAVSNEQAAAKYPEWLEDSEALSAGGRATELTIRGDRCPRSPFLRLPEAYRPANAATSSSRVAMLIRPISTPRCCSVGSKSNGATGQSKGASQTRQCGNHLDCALHQPPVCRARGTCCARIYRSR